jgi:hypothetical protein
MAARIPEIEHLLERLLREPAGGFEGCEVGLTAVRVRRGDLTQ